MVIMETTLADFKDGKKPEIRKWSPDLSDVPCKKVAGMSLLNVAIEALHCSIKGRMMDDNGTYAYVLDDAVLVAKRYIYGYIVSAHEKAVKKARDNNLNLVMYIGNQNKFYSFNPSKVIEQSHENVRGGSVMLNWSIRLGVAYK